MFRLYFVSIISVLIITTYTVNGFFLQDLTNITATRNISCRSNNTEVLIGDFQYCAIRIYTGSIEGQNVSIPIYNGLRYLNTFRRFIDKRCNQFVSQLNDGIDTGTGSGSCGTPRPFETFTELQLCICATGNCNQDWDSCINSTISNTNITALTDFIPLLIPTVTCNNNSNASNICQEHPFINLTACQDFVRNNSVLCAVTTAGNETTQIPLIFDNYEAFLTEQIYKAKSIPISTVATSYNETNTTFYLRYSDSQSQIVEECVCTSYPNCNQNINTCVLQTTLQIEATTGVPSSTEIFTEGITSAFIYTSAVISTTAASSIISTAVDTSTSSVATETSIGSTTTNSSQNTSMATTLTSSTIAITSTNIKTVITSVDLITTISSTITPSVATTTTAQRSEYFSILRFINNFLLLFEIANVTGEPGLGRAATAGIACGIIFSVVIFTAEIVFLKFVYPHFFGNGGGRSNAYLT